MLVLEELLCGTVVKVQSIDWSLQAIVQNIGALDVSCVVMNILKRGYMYIQYIIAEDRGSKVKNLKW